MATVTPRRRAPAEPLAIDATGRALGCPVFGFADQPHLAELTSTTVSDRARVVGVSLSYTYYRYPIHRNSPSNFVDLTPAQSLAIERAETSALPAWMIEQITRIRYPALWDAVRTAKSGPSDAKNALELRLAAHANDVLRTHDPQHVPVRAPQATRTGRISPGDLLETTCLIVDGQPHRGFLLQVGPHMVAVGARVDDDRYLTAVYDRRTAPRLVMQFTSHQSRPAPTRQLFELEPAHIVR